MIICFQSLMISVQMLDTLDHGCKLVGQRRNGVNKLWLLWKDLIPQSMSLSGLHSPHHSLLLPLALQVFEPMPAAFDFEQQAAGLMVG